MTSTQNKEVNNLTTNYKSNRMTVKSTKISKTSKLGRLPVISRFQ